MVICGVYKPSGPNMDITVGTVDGRNSHHVYGRYSHPSPESNNSEEDYSSEVHDENCEKAQKSNKYRLWKPQPAGPSKSRSFSIHAPQSSQCLTGQTCDRPSIQALQDAFPETKQVLLLEALFSNPNPSANEKGKQGITPQDHTHMSQFVAKLSRDFQLQREAAQLQKRSSCSRDSVAAEIQKILLQQREAHLQQRSSCSRAEIQKIQLQQREAAQQIRALTKDTQKIRALTKGKQLSGAHLDLEQVISDLISWLSSTDSETQEHAVTALYNLSNLAANKKLIVKKGAVQPMLDVLKNGSMTARENAAAALSNLSEVFDNKIVI